MLAKDEQQKPHALCEQGLVDVLDVIDVDVEEQAGSLVRKLGLFPQLRVVLLILGVHGELGDSPRVRRAAGRLATVAKPTTALACLQGRDVETCAQS